MAERVVRNVENDYLMCSICLGRYQDPRLLPCGHSFCRQCLDDHVKQTVTDSAAQFFMCPNDRTQIERPAVGLPPKRWAEAFPVDTFLSSLVSAVMIHASTASDGETSTAVCKQHKNRLKEFFCVHHCVSACALCVVKSHKEDKCDCVSLEEAVDRLRPKMDALRNTLQKQVKVAKSLQQRNDASRMDFLDASKDRVLTELTDLETKMTFYFRTALQQIADMKSTVQEAGKSMVTENASAIVSNINETIEKFDEVCNNGSGPEIFKIVSKMETQVKEYENALKTLVMLPPRIEVHFAINRNTERIFENFPVLGSVIIQSPGHQGYVCRGHHGCSPTSAYDHANAKTTPVPRLSLGSLETARTARSSRSVSQSTNRSDFTDSPRSVRSPTRPKVTVSVQIVDQANTSWQLTGVAIIGDCLVITDAHNNQVFRFETRPSGAMPEQLSIDCPVCVAPGHGGSVAMVTQPEHRKLSLLDVGNGLVVKEFIETAKPYEGIAKLLEERYAVSCCVVDRQCIDIIDVAGTILQTIDKDDTGNMILSWPRFLSATTGGDILVSDRDKRALICISLAGRVKWTYPTNASPWGVTCHNSGSVYLCLDTKEIQVLTEAGSLVKRGFVSRRDDIQVPYAIHAVEDYIAVTEWGSNLFAPSSPRVHMFAT
ncbi:tripartite motif-containing protein 3-like [Dreissena polymorpha]|uniref:RING-type domain-containing protein n=1 Tax=Dreissena polymorpha TaxID=45954 RepID=A0A9D4R1F1_DREPO|nr:tripartite motif-containing protein 3-like [Dreissena polymorpha]KAH3850603.1 hypothetical protein DPMN_093026 [Dreissena polymorpha]